MKNELTTAEQKALETLRHISRHQPLVLPYAYTKINTSVLHRLKQKGVLVVNRVYARGVIDSDFKLNDSTI